MKKIYEAPIVEEVRFTTEDITIELPGMNPETGSIQTSYYTCDRM